MEEISKEIFKNYIEVNENMLKYQPVVARKFVALNAYVRNEERSQINNLTYSLKKPKFLS